MRPENVITLPPSEYSVGPTQRTILEDLHNMTGRLNRYKKDARQQLPHLREKKEFAGRTNEEIVLVHMSELLDAEAHLAKTPLSAGDYEDRVRAINAKIEKKDKLALGNTTQEHRIVRRALKAAKPFGGRQLLYTRTGLTEEMVKEAKKAGRKEMLKTGAWFVGSEGLSLGAAWLANLTSIQEHIPTHDWRILLPSAILGRVILLRRLAKKGKLNAERIELNGTGTDPVSKTAHEMATDDPKKSSKKGFWAINGASEVWNTINTVAIGAVSGSASAAFVSDIVGSTVAAIKLGIENMVISDEIKGRPLIKWVKQKFDRMKHSTNKSVKKNEEIGMLFSEIPSPKVESLL